MLKSKRFNIFHVSFYFQDEWTKYDERLIDAAYKSDRERIKYVRLHFFFLLFIVILTTNHAIVFYPINNQRIKTVVISITNLLFFF